MILLSLSIALAHSEAQLVRYLVAAVAAYVTISVALERVIPRTKALGHLKIERDIVTAGEPFRISVSMMLWIVPLIEVSQVVLEGSNGVSISRVSTTKELGSLNIDVWAVCRVGTHRISELQVYARLRVLAMTLRASLIANVTVRAVPKLDEAVMLRGAGAPHDIGLSSIGKPGPGSQFYMNREYKPGDDLRRVDWKASSRTGKLAVKVFEREVYRKVVFVVPVTERYFVGFSKAFDDLTQELMRVVAELVRRGTEVAVALVSRTYGPIPAFVRVRNTDEVASLAEYFSHVAWSGGPSDCHLEYRSALWISVKILTGAISGRSVVVYLGEPESDVDLVAGRVVANIVKSMGHEPVFAIVSPELLRVSEGEASVEDLVRLMRAARVAFSELSHHARVVYFYGEGLLRFLLRAIAI